METQTTQAKLIKEYKNEKYSSNLNSIKIENLFDCPLVTFTIFVLVQNVFTVNKLFVLVFNPF